MGKKSKPKIYYWLPVIVLFGMFCVLGIVMLTSFPQLSKIIPDSQLADISWTSNLERALSSLGVEVQDIKLVGSLDQQRQLQISISNVINGEEPEPYYLVSGIHLAVGAGLYVSEAQPRRIDSILVIVLDQNDVNLYTVILREPDLRAVFFQEITEQEYLNRWIIGENAPQFIINMN